MVPRHILLYSSTLSANALNVTSKQAGDSDRPSRRGFRARLVVPTVAVYPGGGRRGSSIHRARFGVPPLGELDMPALLWDLLDQSIMNECSLPNHNRSASSFASPAQDLFPCLSWSKRPPL